MVDGQQTITADGKIDGQAGGKQTDRQTLRRTGSKIRRQKDTTAQQIDRRAHRKNLCTDKGTDRLKWKITDISSNRRIDKKTREI